VPPLSAKKGPGAYFEIELLQVYSKNIVFRKWYID